MPRRTGPAHPNFRHGQSGTPLYRVWQTMRQRCENPQCPRYKSYGGRGISVCERWHDFANFYADVSGEYQAGLTVERRDVHGDYNPDNCCWVPAPRQAINRQRTPYVVFRGARMAFADAWRAANSPVRRDTAWTRFHRSGWPLERALTEPQVRGAMRRSGATCMKGHELTPENTRVDGRGRRHCRACVRAASARYLKLRRAA